MSSRSCTGQTQSRPPCVGQPLMPGMMWSAIIQTVFVLPVLVLVSIPFALAASLTMLLAFSALFLRAFIVYIELASALLINFFLFPAHSPTTGSFLAFSEANSPDTSPSHSKSHHRHRVPPREAYSWGENFPASTEADYFFSHHPHSGPSLASSREPFSNFVSGDAERDFEGVGGWRTPMIYRKRLPISSSPTGSYSTSEEGLLDDDQAWSSLNKRLELPSRQFNFKPPSVLQPSTTAADTSKHERPRYHKRSITTSSLTVQGTLSSSLPAPSEHGNITSSHLHTSKSSTGLENMMLLPSSSKRSHAPLSPFDQPFLMTSSGSGDEWKMAHYPSFVRRRSSASSTQTRP